MYMAISTKINKQLTYRDDILNETSISQLRDCCGKRERKTVRARGKEVSVEEHYLLRPNRAIAHINLQQL